MATRTPTIEYNVDNQRSIARVVWSGLLNGDDGAPVEMPEYPDRTVHFSGTFGAGGSIQLEGSNEKATESPTYNIVTDPQGNTVVKGAAAIEVIEEAPLIFRPKVTAGDGSTNLTVKMLCRRPRV